MELEDYYEILEIARKASLEEISSQFRSLALKYHPLRNPTNMALNQQRFAQICEAHEVLSDGKQITDRETKNVSKLTELLFYSFSQGNL